VLPIIRGIRASGIATNEGIAEALNCRFQLKAAASATTIRMAA
jgi:hypothetical protein